MEEEEEERREGRCGRVWYPLSCKLAEEMV